MVGFKDSLLVQVKSKHLNDLTTLIFCPSIVIFIRGIVTCEKKIWAAVLLTFIQGGSIGIHWDPLESPGVHQVPSIFININYVFKGL